MEAQNSISTISDYSDFLINQSSLSSSLNISSQSLDKENIFILPWYQQVFWSLLFGLMVIVAAGGNLIVIWIVLIHRRMRTVTNYFIVNLSIADTMVSLLNVVFNFVFMLDGNWPFGESYCKFSNFISILSVAASVFTLMAISIDRYTAIMYPLKPRMSRKTTLIITIVIWVASGTLAWPNVMFSMLKREDFLNGDSRTICYMVWPDGETTQSFMEYVYNVIILLVTYVVPIMSMSVTYFRVGKELWGSQSIGETTAKQIENIKSKRKIVKMMIVVVVIFSVCWLPYHIYFLLVSHYPEILETSYIQHVYLFIYFLAMSNSMYNPIIYCWMNSRFREGFRQVFCCLCLRSGQVTTETPLHREVEISQKTRLSCADGSPSPAESRALVPTTVRNTSTNGSTSHENVVVVGDRTNRTSSSGVVCELNLKTITETRCSTNSK